MDGQTVNFSGLGQTSTWTPSVVGSDSKPVPNGAFTATPAVGDSTIVELTGHNDGTFTVTPLALGSTTITWTIAPAAGGGYSGAPIVLPADTINVGGLTIASASGAYSVPQ
jgi:hypothetical protein